VSAVRKLWRPLAFIAALVGTVYAADCYYDAVQLDSPCSYWRMDSPYCTTDTREGNQTTLAGHGGCIDKLAASATPVVRGTPGIPGARGDPASLFSANHFLYDTGGSFNDCAGEAGGSAHPCDASSNPHDFTVEAWVKPASSANGAIVVKAPKANNGGSNSWSYDLTQSATGHFGCTQWDNQQGGNYAVTGASTATYTPGTWYHVACTVTASSYVIQLWVNGVADASSSTIDGAEPCGRFGTFQIGVYGAEFTPTPGPTPPAANIPFFYDGFIDEVATYNHVLSSTRLAEHYSIGISTLGCGSPFWPFTVQRDDGWQAPNGVPSSTLRQDAYVRLLTDYATICGGGSPYDMPGGLLRAEG
jgi:hypothetical protein